MPSSFLLIPLCKSLESRTNFSGNPTFPSTVHRALGEHYRTPSQGQRSRATFFYSALCFSPVVNKKGDSEKPDKMYFCVLKPIYVNQR